MVSNSIVSGFSLRDFLTRIIPGTILIGPGIGTLYIIYPENFSDLPIILAILAVSALIVGETVHLVSSGLFRVPAMFRSFVYYWTGDINDLSFSDRLKYKIRAAIPFLSEYTDEDWEGSLIERLPVDFRAELESELSVDISESYYRDVYDLLLLDLQPLSARTTRYQTIYYFYKNCFLSVGASLLIYIALALWNAGDSTFLYPIGILILILLAFFMIFSVLFAAPALYVEMLLKEFYAKRIENSSDTNDSTGTSG